MKKLELKNLKVVKLTNDEKKNVVAGKQRPFVTSGDCNVNSGPYVSWCHSCPA